MAKRVQRYRVSGSVMTTLIGKAGELIVNLTNNSVHVHDEITAGGFELARADVDNVQQANSLQDGKMSAAQALALTVATAGIATNVTNITTNVTNIATNTANITTNTAAIALKANKIAPSAANNIATLTAGGDLQDSGKLITDAGLSAGTKTTFFQAAAPIGWTKSTAHNNKAMRIVSGAGGGSAGVVGFTTVFGRTATDNHTLLAAQSGMPAHTPTLINNTAVQRIIGGGTGTTGEGSSTSTITVNQVPAQNAASGHAHNIDLRVQYIDMIIATKD